MHTQTHQDNLLRALLWGFPGVTQPMSSPPSQKALPRASLARRPQLGKQVLCSNCRKVWNKAAAQNFPQEIRDAFRSVTCNHFQT